MGRSFTNTHLLEWEAKLKELPIELTAAYTIFKIHPSGELVAKILIPHSEAVTNPDALKDTMITNEFAFLVFIGSPLPNILFWYLPHISPPLLNYSCNSVER